MEKNAIYEVTIEDMGVDGAGIGKVDGFPLFIKDAVIGDVAQVKIIKLKKNYGYGRLLSLVDPSIHRVEAKCHIYKQCGGCQIQGLKYEEQLKYKENKIRNNMLRIGKFDDFNMMPIIGAQQPFRYRNKAQFPVGKDKDGSIVAGFYASRTHCIVPNTNCYLGIVENEMILEMVLAYMKHNHIEPYDEQTGVGLVRHVLIRYGFATKELMVCLVINGRQLPNVQELLQSLSEIDGMKSIMLNVNCKNTNVILGEEMILLWGDDYITDSIGGIQYQISPHSFYQINPVQTQKLYQTALDYAGLTGKETVWDLYCGIGTISLFLAKNARQVYGVEIIPQAIEDAKKNASLNSITNVEFFVGAAEEVLPQKYQESDGKMKADVIVIDPPRKGCETTLLDAIIAVEPERVVYVSCDSATLARDLRYLCDRGYEILKAQGLDQFCQTVHVETVCLLSKLKSNHHIEVNLNMDELDLTSAESKATYEEIKDYVLENSGLKVSSLYIGQVKEKMGI